MGKRHLIARSAVAAALVLASLVHAVRADDMGKLNGTWEQVGNPDTTSCAGPGNASGGPIRIVVRQGMAEITFGGRGRSWLPAQVPVNGDHIEVSRMGMGSSDHLIINLDGPLIGASLGCDRRPIRRVSSVSSPVWNATAG